MKKFVKVVLIIIAVIGVIQLIPVDRTNPPVKSSENFIHLQKTPIKISEIMRNACYDCHSNETKYPPYAYIAPFSWSVKNHINEGREKVNFSIWGSYSDDLKMAMLKNSIASVASREMPIPGYIVYHTEANLNDAERKLLTDYFQKILDDKSY